MTAMVYLGADRSALLLEDSKVLPLCIAWKREIAPWLVWMTHEVQSSRRSPEWLREEVPMPVSQDLSVLISQAEFRSLPSEAVEVAKTVILDGLGVTLAGPVEPPARIVAEYTREMGGTPHCSVWSQGFKTSPVMAAFANGVAGHVLDYEVMWHPATHATSPTLPGILALAESQQRSG
jgi:hypothetical protein